jgi:hypothetical protein
MTGARDHAPRFRTRAGERGSDDSPTEPISPELALVDPVAAAAARAALPDRPWEEILSRGRHLPVLEPAVAARPDPLVESVGSRGVQERTAQQAPTAQPPRRNFAPRGPFHAARRLAWMAAWAVMITGLTLLAEVHSPNSPALGSASEPLVSVPMTQLAPVPGAAYLIPSGGGFRIGARGRAIRSLVLPVPCLESTQVPLIPIDRQGAFRFNGAVGRGDRRVRLWVSGRFTDPLNAVAVVTVRGSTCPRREIRFAAHLRL